jgi:hypothetical protein
VDAEETSTLDPILKIAQAPALQKEAW